MRKVTLALSLAASLSLLAQAAPAQVRPFKFGPEVSLATKNIGPGIGARAVFTGLANAVRVVGLEAYGSFDWFFPSSSFGATPTYWEINVNGTWSFPTMAPVKPYVGAGLNYAHSSYSATILGVSGSNTANNTGLNVLGGARFHPTPKLDMFGEVRLELRSGSPLVFTVGLLF